MNTKEPQQTPQKEQTTSDLEKEKLIYLLRESKINEFNNVRSQPNVNLSGVNLSGVNLMGADLSWANLTKANLSGANLTKANLSGANLTKANLSGANLIGADFSGSSFMGVDLSDVNIMGANLWLVTGLPNDQRRLILDRLAKSWK